MPNFWIHLFLIGKRPIDQIFCTSCYRSLLTMPVSESSVRNLDVFDMFRLFLFLCAIMLHDCIYQFLRLFYHSRFKPPQLEMTLSQFATPVIDLVLVLPLILRLLKDFSRFSNETKMRIKSKSGINVRAGRNNLENFRWFLIKVSYILPVFHLIDELSCKE